MILNWYILNIHSFTRLNTLSEEGKSIQTYNLSDINDIFHKIENDLVYQEQRTKERPVKESKCTADPNTKSAKMDNFSRELGCHLINLKQKI